MIHRIVLLGSSMVGKTTLLSSLSNSNIKDPFEHIIIEFKDCIFHFQDTSGDEEWDRLRPFSYADASIVLLCYSVTSPDSYLEIQEKWSPEICYYLPNASIILIATHTDMENRTISHQEGLSLSKQINALSYMEVQSHFVPLELLEVISMSRAVSLELMVNDTVSSCESQGSLSGASGDAAIRDDVMTMGDREEGHIAEDEDQDDEKTQIHQEDDEKTQIHLQDAMDFVKIGTKKKKGFISLLGRSKRKKEIDCSLM